MVSDMAVSEPKRNACGENEGGDVVYMKGVKAAGKELIWRLKGGYDSFLAKFGAFKSCLTLDTRRHVKTYRPTKPLNLMAGTKFD